MHDYTTCHDNEKEEYTANSGYKMIHVLPAQNDIVLEAVYKHHFDHLWKTTIPFRIKAFGWRCLWNRLPIKRFASYQSYCVFTVGDVLLLLYRQRYLIASVMWYCVFTVGDVLLLL